MRGSQHRESELLRAEASIEERSGAFKKELGLMDLVFTQILFIIGLGWIGTAAKLGSSHFVFWLLAVVLFCLPSAAVVIYLNTLCRWKGACTSGPSLASTNSQDLWSPGISGSTRWS